LHQQTTAQHCSSQETPSNNHYLSQTHRSIAQKTSNQEPNTKNIQKLISSNRKISLYSTLGTLPIYLIGMAGVFNQQRKRV